MTIETNMVAALQRLNGREMLINTDTADEFIAGLTRFSTTDRAEAAALEVTSRENLCMTYGIDDRPEGDGRKSFVYQDGIAVIPVHGTLLNRFNSSWGFATGYNFIRRQLNDVLDDEDVDSFIFDMNSPGGEASGCFELAREILASRRVKPSLCMIDSLMASGGTALGGAATRVYGIPSARVGSIGVYRQHISVEGALKDAGVKITFAQAGEHKTDGHMYADLPDSVLKDWTKDLNKTWDDFIELVADCRGMEPEDVRATQARIYRADEALALGLINAVKTTTEAVPAFVADMASDSPDDEEDDDMENGKKTEVASTVDYGKIGELISSGVSTAMTAMFGMQNRANAIRDHGKAKGQVALAAKLAGNDKLTEAEAIEMIDAAAVAAKPTKITKVKGKAKVALLDDEDEGEDEDAADEGEEDEGDEDEGEGDDEGDEETARASRRGNKAKRKAPRDTVNHLDRAMSGNKREKVGGGNGNDNDAGLNADAKATNVLLGDYARQTGTVLGNKKSATA